MSRVPPPPSYVALHDTTGGMRPPHSYNAPRYPSYKKKSSSCCYKCICFCYCCLLLLLLFIVISIICIYILYKPQIPSYEIKNFEVQSFEFQPDFTLVTDFIVNVKADNPNEIMEFIYGSGSSVNVRYTDLTLCNGSIPEFQQPPKNMTVIDVLLKGKNSFGSGLQQAFMDNQKGGKIPLLVMIKVPVNIVFGNLKMRQITAHVNCSLVVDNLSPDKKISILSTKYDVRISI